MKGILWILVLLGFVSLGFARFTAYSAGFDSGLNGFSAGTWDNTDGASQPGCVHLVDPNYADDGSENSYHPQFWVGPNCTFPDEVTISYSMKLISGTPKTHINVMVRNRNNSPECGNNTTSFSSIGRWMSHCSFGPAPFAIPLTEAR